MQIVRVKTGDAEMRAAAIQALLDRGTPALDRMIEALNESNWQHQRHMIEATARFGEACVDPLLAKLHGAPPMLQIGIAHTLGAVGDARAIAPLIVLMRSAEAEVRDAAGAALAQFGPRALRPLVLALRDPNWRVRTGAAMALAAVKERRAMYPLIASLHDPYAQVRAAAARALGELRDPRAVEALLNALRDAELLVRSQAAVALGRIRDDRAIEPLVNTLTNARPPSVRANAALALGLIGSERAIEALVAALADEANSVRAWASGALVRLGPQSVAPLIAALENPDFGGRKRALWALGTLRDNRAREIILRMCASSDPETRKAAEQAIEKLDTPFPPRGPAAEEPLAAVSEPPSTADVSEDASAAAAAAEDHDTLRLPRDIAQGQASPDTGAQSADAPGTGADSADSGAGKNPATHEPIDKGEN